MGPGAKQWSDRQWLFSLRLTTLNSSEELKRCIIDPALKLLRGETILSALPSSIEGLMHYTDTLIYFPLKVNKL